MMAVPGPARAAWLLVRLRLRRLANMVTTMQFGGKRKKAGSVDGRKATPGKRRAGGLFAILMVASMAFSFTHMAHQSVLNLQCAVVDAGQCTDDEGSGDSALAAAEQELAVHGFSESLARAAALQLLLLSVASFLVPLGSREIASADWDLEWLATLPAKRTTLLAARIAERTVANPTGLFALVPPCLMFAWFSGYRWSAPLIGVAGAFALLPIAAVLRTIADTGLRMTLSAARLRNLQALCGLASLPFMYIAMSFGMPRGGALIGAVTGGLPAWLMWTPPGLLVRLVTARSAHAAVVPAAMLAVELVACLWLGMAILGRQLRDGVVASGVRETGRKSPLPLAAAAGRPAMLQRLLPRSPVQRRELRLLSRDRNFLVQSFLMPVTIVGSQLLLNSGPGTAGALAGSPVALVLTAWGISAYMLMLSAFQTLNNEGQVLWMLYTFPRPLESVLADKAKMWAVLALVYPLAVLLFGLAIAPVFDWRIVSGFALVVAGIPIFTVIAVALGVFACDPLSEDVRNRVRPSYLYLYMLLVSMYGYAIYADSPAKSLVILVLTGCLAQALWQKARDALPYLLDPAAAPPPRVSTADGMMAAMLFFVLQALAFILLARARSIGPNAGMVLAFLAAGALTYLLVRLSYLRSRTAGVPAVFAGRTLPTLAWGIGGGLVAAGAGLAYLALVRGTPWWNAMAPSGGGLPMHASWLLPLAVLLAPVFEEFIFRGLIFGGLRRSMGLLPSMLMSAGLFAIVHPPASMLPVFVVGLCTAWVYERNKGLAAPMLVHAVYNAVVLGSQM
jgi:ABC-2 type transport system permease protein